MKSFLSKTAFFLCLAVFAGSASAQDTCVLLFSIPQKADFATADHLANTYLLRGFEVEKYDSTGKFVSRYSNNRLGRASFLDASNPLKLLLWYADFQTAVFLDRNLTELGRLNVAEAGWPAVRSIAIAADGNLWAYDEGTAQLLKMSTAGEKLLESQPLSLEFPRRFAPTCIRDDGGQGVFLSDPAQGVAIFDPFAQMNKVLTIKGLTQFEVENGILFFVEGLGIRIEHWRSLVSRTIPLPITLSSAKTTWYLSQKRLFGIAEESVALYGF